MKSPSEFKFKTTLAAWGLIVMAGLSTVAQNLDLTGGTQRDRTQTPVTREQSGQPSDDAAARRGEDAARADRSARKPAAPPAPKPKPKPKAPVGPVAPPMSALMPGTPQGQQSMYWPTREQMANARTIVQVGRELGLPPRAAVIAISTALQESKLNNFGHLGDRNDHDSLGLFQQRPSSGWGTPQQLTNPRYAATAFYKALMQVPGWQNLPVTVAAQKVQVSAFPFAYAQWESMARHVVLAYYNVGPFRLIEKHGPEKAKALAAKEDAARENAARDKAAKDKAAKDKAAKDKAAKDKATRDKAAHDKAAKDKAAHDKAAKDKAAKDTAARDHAARDRAHQDRLAKERAANALAGLGV